MFKPLALFVGLRYTRARQRNFFISFMAMSSMIGIALGVAVLITVLSVMNGFDDEIRNRFFKMAPQVNVTSPDGFLSDWQPLGERLQKYPGVSAVAPYAGKQALITHDGQDITVVASGVLPEFEKNMSEINNLMQAGKLGNLVAGEFNIVIGRTIANQLGLQLGDKVTLLIPQFNFAPTGVQPRIKRFTVAGIFNAGAGFGFDEKLTFIHLEDAQTLMMLGKNITGYRLKLNDIYQAPQLSAKIYHDFEGQYSLTNWTEQFGAFFHAIKMEKNIMFLILMLIIAVAAFNLVSSLVMVVTDKQSEIAIMRTYGMQAKTVIQIFIVQGLLIGLIGTVIGLIGGLILASNVTPIVEGLQRIFGIELFTKGVYYTDYLPSKIVFSDVVEVSILAITLSFLATLYPAWSASRVQPAEALRYE